MLLKIGEKEYELKYSLKRVETIESTTGTPLMASITSSRGMMPLTLLKSCFCYGLKEPGSDSFIPLPSGQVLFEQALTEHGYAGLVSVIIEALQRDCPFFFQAD